LPFEDCSICPVVPFLGTSLPEIALSAWMLASSFAGSPRCAFTLTRNVAAPAVVLLGSSSIASVKCLRLALLLTSLSRLHLPIFLQLSAALGCRTNKARGLSQGCRVMPRQMPASSGRFELHPSSLRPTFLCCLFLFFSQVHSPCSHFPSFLVRSITRCDCASRAVTS